ncbi:MAG: hypothetical protein PHV33_10895, partial [Elusimicrobiales bacterium]|nr:hypothetical protein [Elusimicrobiales bacterium]
MKTFKARITKILTALLLLPVIAAAAPSYINYQGRLVDATGNPLSGTYSIVFSVYNDPTAGTPGTALWTETQPTVTVDNGIFSAKLGSVTSLPPSVFSGDTRYLGVKIGADAEMLPRTELLSVPYAIYAASAASVGTPGQGVIISTFVQVNDYISATRFIGDGSGLTGISAGGSSIVLPIVSTHIADGAITAAKLNSTIMVEGENISLLNNNAGYITSADDAVSGTELDGVFSTLGLLRRTAANTYSTVADNSANWDTAFGWGNHGAAGYATAANLNSVIASTQPLVNYANWDTAFGWGNHGAAGYATAVNLNSVIASTQPLVNYANWDTAFGWGNHGAAGYATAANLNSVIASTQPLVNYANWDTAFGWGNHGAAGYATAANLNSVIASTQPLVNYANWDTAFGWGNHAGAGYMASAARGAANGVAPLDAGTKLGITYLASCADTQILKFSGGAWTCATDNEGAGGTVTGSGLANKVAFWSSGAALSSTTMHWDGLNQRLGVGNASPLQTLDVAGSIKSSYGLIASTMVLSDTSAGALTVAGGITAGGNAIINTSGKIPALSTAYFGSIDGSALTGITPADNSVTSAKIAAGEIVDSDISNIAVISISKLATTGTLGADVQVSSVAIAAFYPSADIRTNLGLGALATKATVATADIDALAVTDAKINDVAGSKITGAGSIVADRIASGALGANVMTSSVAIGGFYPSADIRTNLGLGALATAASVSGGAGGTITDDSVIDADIKSNA